MPEVADAPGSKPSRNRRLFEVGIVLASSVLGLALLEAALWATGRIDPPVEVPVCGFWDPATCAMYQPSTDYGYALVPSSRMEYLYPQTNPRLLEVRSNRDGFRSSREFDGPDDRTRVTVLGDSFVFGEGVAQRERFTDVLEQRMDWRFDNLGMTGWGPDLMLRALEKLAPQTNPDIVLVSMYTHDFRRLQPFYAGVGFAIPRYELVDDRLVSMPYPKPAPWHRLRLYWALNSLQRSEDWDMHAAVLDRLRELAEQRSFRLVVAFLPASDDLPVDRTRREWLRDYAVDHEVPYIDLTDLIQAAPHDEIFIHGGNPHWNAAGHALVAGALEPFLRSSALFEQSPGR